jgi:hypothetical protein
VREREIERWEILGSQGERERGVTLFKGGGEGDVAAAPGKEIERRER